MPGLDVDVELRKKGPLFGDKATPRIKQFLDEAEKTVAQEGYNRVRTRLSRVLRKPTGRYESRIQTERTSNGWEVNDSRRVVYGPWLEGTGSRNRTTRFKGYKTFRLVKQELDRDVKQIIRPLLQRMLGDLNQ